MRRFGPALLLALTPACVVQKSVGDDPETAGVDEDGGELPESGSTSTSGGSISVSSTQGGTGTSTPDYAACGLDVVPVMPGEPFYVDEITCESCTLTIESAVPTGFDIDDVAAGDCICGMAGCGGWTGDTMGSGYDPSATGDTPDTESTTGPTDCGFHPEPWEGAQEFSARCVCETCEFVFEDISEADAVAFSEDEAICECLCEQGNCGGVEGWGEVGGPYSTGDAPDTDGDTATSTSG